MLRRSMAEGFAYPTPSRNICPPRVARASKKIAVNPFDRKTKAKGERRKATQAQQNRGAPRGFFLTMGTAWGRAPAALLHNLGSFLPIFTFITLFPSLLLLQPFSWPTLSDFNQLFGCTFCVFSPRNGGRLKPNPLTLVFFLSPIPVCITQDFPVLFSLSFTHHSLPFRRSFLYAVFSK